MRQQTLLAALRNRLAREVMPLTQARQQSFGQLQNVVPALAQRRELESKQVEPMEQILAKFAFRDELFEIAVGRGDDADVDGKFPRAAQSAELSVFNPGPHLL